jgi:pimeloyl-ACP methyl ester carboxylesterase
MQIKRIGFTTEQDIQTVNRLWTVQEGKSRDLIVMLPGRGYTIDHPLFHYLAQIAVQRGIDAFGVQYSFQATGEDFKMDEMTALSIDVVSAVGAFMIHRKYNRIIVVAKSLGTAIMTALDDILPTVTARIMLTPIPGMEPARPAPMLSVVGTADPFYRGLQAAIASPAKDIQWHVVEGANHALEYDDDWRSSLGAMLDVLEACEGFIDDQLPQ